MLVAQNGEGQAVKQEVDSLRQGVSTSNNRTGISRSQRETTSHRKQKAQRIRLGFLLVSRGAGDRNRTGPRLIDWQPRLLASKDPASLEITTSVARIKTMEACNRSRHEFVTIAGGTNGFSSYR